MAKTVSERQAAFRARQAAKKAAAYQEREAAKATAIAAVPVVKPPSVAEQTRQAFLDFVARYEGDPVGFVRNVLGAKPKRWQRVFMRKVAAGRRRVSIKAGHGVGKSTAVAWILIWSVVCRHPQKGVVTAPTAPQLFDALFAELKSWINRLPPVIRGLLEPFSDRIELKADPDGSFISARTSSAERPEAMAGVHSKHVILVADEAPGIPEAVYESAVGSMSGKDATTILIGNPTRLNGLFFKTHHELADKWDCMTVSCLDPDLADLIDRDFIQQIVDTYGEESDQYRVRVLGEFPRSESNTLIAADLVEAAMNRDVILNPGEPLVYGVDVARSLNGDRSVICKRRGNVVLDLKTRMGNDLMETVGWVVAEARIDNPDEICVDSIGMGGGVADRLRELKFNVRDVNVAESSAMNPQAARLRDELWLTTRDWLNLRTGKLPKMEALKVELSAPLFAHLSNGKYKIETKEEMKKRLKRSPDLADALCFEGSTLIATPLGARRIDEIRVDDEVTTPFGTAKVGIVWVSETNTITEVKFSNGSVLRGKGEHKVFTFDAGPVRLDALRLTNEMDGHSYWSLVLWRIVKLSSIAAQGLGFKHLADTTLATTGETGRIAFFIAGCGLTATALSRRATTFITRMMTGATTTLAIWNVFPFPSIAATTCAAGIPRPRGWLLLSRGSRTDAPPPPRGTPPMRGAHGTQGMAAKHGPTESPSRFRADDAAPPSRLTSSAPNIAPMPADKPRTSKATSPRIARVFFAARNFWRTVTARRGIVPVSVATATGPAVKVFNLTLDRDNAYYANGILAFNCLTFAGESAVVGGRASRWIVGEPLIRGIRGTV